MNKNLAFLLVALLVLDCAVGHTTHAHSKSLRSNGKSLTSGVDYCRNRAGKHITVLEKPKVLVKDMPACGCGGSSSHTTTTTTRTYETIGMCQTTVDLSENTNKTVDKVTHVPVNVKTVTNHNTAYQTLTNTSTTKRILSYHNQNAQKLSHRSITLLEQFTTLVDIDTIAVSDTTIQTVSAQSAVVQTLRSTCKNIRVLTSEKVKARRVTGTCGKITMVFEVHETVHQSARRSIDCLPKSVSVSVCGCN